MKWYQFRWYWQTHKAIIVVVLVLVLWGISMTVSAHRANKEADTLSTLVAVQAHAEVSAAQSRYYLSMVLDSTYSKLEMIESEIISLAGEMNKIRKGR